MGQKTNPISNRIGITRGWDSNWCGNYPERIKDDAQIREYLNARLQKASVSRIIIERTMKVITISSSRHHRRQERPGAGDPQGRG